MTGRVSVSGGIAWREGATEADNPFDPSTQRTSFDVWLASYRQAERYYNGVAAMQDDQGKGKTMRPDNIMIRCVGGLADGRTEMVEANRSWIEYGVLGGGMGSVQFYQIDTRPQDDGVYLAHYRPSK